MPLAHFILEARKNTPTLVKKPAETVLINEEKAIEISGSELKREMAGISHVEKEIAAEKATTISSWKQCQYLKNLADRPMCKQYMVLCAKDKCQQKFMDAGFFDFKKYLKSGRTIK